jgi:hypothetical protein
MSEQVSSAEWAVVRTCTTLAEARFLCSVLGGSEIDCYLPDEHMASVQPGAVIALGGIRMMVPADELEHARDVLAQADTSDVSLHDDV